MGWCLGGGGTLSAATVEPVEATVIYYNRDMVTLFELGMLKVHKRSITYCYMARHSFANPTGARYYAEDAALACAARLQFLCEAYVD